MSDRRQPNSLLGPAIVFALLLGVAAVIWGFQALEKLSWLAGIGSLVLGVFVYRGAHVSNADVKEVPKAATPKPAVAQKGPAVLPKTPAVVPKSSIASSKKATVLSDMTLSESYINLGTLEFQERLETERIYVHGGSGIWVATTKATWLRVSNFKDYFDVSLSPQPGRNHGVVEVLDRKTGKICVIRFAAEGKPKAVPTQRPSTSAPRATPPATGSSIARTAPPTVGSSVARSAPPTVGSSVARATPSAAGNPSPQADRFDVILFGANSSNKKILQIKVTREVLGYGLKEAKDLVEALPQTVVRRVDAATARRIAAALEGAHGLSARTVPSSKSA